MIFSAMLALADYMDEFLESDNWCFAAEFSNHDGHQGATKK